MGTANICKLQGTATQNILLDSAFNGDVISVSQYQKCHGIQFNIRSIVLISIVVTLSALQVAFAQDQGASRTPVTSGMTEEMKLEADASASKTTTQLTRKPTSPNEDKRLELLRSREGRLAVKPLDWNVTIGKPKLLHGQAVKPEKLQHLKPEFSSGGKADPKAKEEARKLYSEDWRLLMQPDSQSKLQDSLKNGTLMLASADTFTQYCENCPNVNTDAPEVAIGKLFTSEGSCSASVVSGNNVIVTAAHCCWNRGTNNWIGGWSFAPGYHQGNAPYGTFNWSSATILNSWINNGDIQSDVCVINLQNDAQGHGVSYYTGWLGRSWDWPAVQNHTALGYPGNLGNGNVLELCASESSAASSSCGGNGILNTGCSMTYGSSGGPWIRNYRTDNWVNSVVHGYDSQNCTGTFGKTFNGARFTSGNIATLCNVAGC